MTENPLDVLLLLKPILLARRRQMLAECRAIEELFGLDKADDLLDPLTLRAADRHIETVVKRVLTSELTTHLKT